MLPCRARGTHGAGTGAPPAATGTRPASAGTGGPPSGGKRALGVAGAGQTGVRRLPTPERPSQRARRLEPRQLARQARSLDRDVVLASRRARRASPPRPAATGDPPPLPHKGQPLWGCTMFSAAFRLPC